MNHLSGNARRRTKLDFEEVHDGKVEGLAEDLWTLFTTPKKRREEDLEAVRRYIHHHNPEALAHLSASEDMNEDLNLMLRHVFLRMYPKGSVIVRQNDPGEEFYITLSGATSVWVRDTDAEKDIEQTVDNLAKAAGATDDEDHRDILDGLTHAVKITKDQTKGDTGKRNPRNPNITPPHRQRTMSSVEKRRSPVSRESALSPKRSSVSILQAPLQTRVKTPREKSPRKGAARRRPSLFDSSYPGEFGNQDEGHGKKVATLETGRAFGEMAMLNPSSKRMASIIAEGCPPHSEVCGHTQALDRKNQAVWAGETRTDLTVVIVVPRHLFEHCLRARHKADINLKTKVEVVRSLKLFRQFGDDPLRDIAVNMRTRFLNEGESLFERGSPNDSLHVVQQGGVTLQLPVMISEDDQPLRGLQRSIQKGGVQQLQTRSEKREEHNKRSSIVGGFGTEKTDEESLSGPKSKKGAYMKLVEVLIVSPHHYCGIGCLDLSLGVGYHKARNLGSRRTTRKTRNSTVADHSEKHGNNASIIHDFTGTAMMAQTKVISIPKEVLNKILADYGDGVAPMQRAIPVCKAALKFSLQKQQDLIYQRIAFAKAHPEMNIPLVSINQHKAHAIRRHSQLLPSQVLISFNIF
jgi:CRP-like cAMP-binding protein